MFAKNRNNSAAKETWLKKLLSLVASGRIGLDCIYNNEWKDNSNFEQQNATNSQNIKK